MKSSYFFLLPLIFLHSIFVVGEAEAKPIYKKIENINFVATVDDGVKCKVSAKALDTAAAFVLANSALKKVDERSSAFLLALVSIRDIDTTDGVIGCAVATHLTLRYRKKIDDVVYSINLLESFGAGVQVPETVERKTAESIEDFTKLVVVEWNKNR